jgi:prepilin-type N-terminal cleavage/methylation domain-containing protein
MRPRYTKKHPEASINCKEFQILLHKIWKGGKMKRKGFTLVEVLIVVIIIGILAAIGIPQFAASIEKAKGGEARAGLGHIQTGEKVYFAENEFYTANIDELDITLSEKYWNFEIEVTGTNSTEYLATANRIGGTHANQTLTMNEGGTISGNWEYK